MQDAYPSQNPNGFMPVKAVFHCDDLSFPIYAATITEAICHSFELEITCHVTHACEANDFLKKIWTVSVEDTNGESRPWVAECFAFDQEMIDVDCWAFTCRLESILTRLKNKPVDLKGEISVDIKLWISAMLTRHGLKDTAQWRAEPHIFRPRLMQVHQNDHDCLLTVLAQENIIVLPATDEPKLHFFSAPEQLSYTTVQRLFVMDAHDLLQFGGARMGAFEYEDVRRHAITPDEYWDETKHWEAQSPLRLYSGVPCISAPVNRAGALAKPCNRYAYDEKSINRLCGSRHFSLTEQGEGYRYITTKSNALVMGAGYCVNISDVKNNDETQCRIQYVKHHLISFGKSLRYHNEMILQPSDGIWRAVSPPKPVIPLIMQAFIQGKDNGPWLDDEGNEFVRMISTVSDEATAVNMPRSRPFVSDNGGFNFPLGDQVEVLITFLYGEPDLPVIIGVLPNDQMKGPTSEYDPYQYILSTRSGHVFRMDDDPANPHIALQVSPTHGMVFRNGSSPGITVLSEGSVNVKSARNIRVQSTKSSHCQSGESASFSAQKSQTIQSIDGNIEVSAPTAIQLTAQKKMNIQSEKDLNMNGNNFNMSVGQDASLTVKQGDMHCHVSGEIALKAGKGVTIQSDEKIEIKSSSGKTLCVIDRDEIILYADQNCLFDADNVIIKGRVHYGECGDSVDSVVQSNMLVEKSADTVEPFPLVLHQFSPTYSSEFYHQEVNPGELDNLFFCIAPKRCSVDALVASIYEKPTASHRELFLSNNSHIKNIVEPGQIAYIASAENKIFQRLNREFQQSASRIDSLRSSVPEAEAQIFADNFALYGSFADSVGARERTYRSSQADSNKKWGMITQVADAFFRGMRNEIELVAKGFQSQSSGPELKKLRDQAVKNMDRMTASFCDNLVKGKTITSSAVVELGLRAQHTFHQWIPTTWKLGSLDDLYSSVTTLHTAAKLGGIGLMAMDFNETQANINMTCRSLNAQGCERVRFEEWGKFAGRNISGTFMPKLIGGGMMLIGLHKPGKMSPLSFQLAATGLSLILLEGTGEDIEEFFCENSVKLYEAIDASQSSQHQILKRNLNLGNRCRE